MRSNEHDKFSLLTIILLFDLYNGALVIFFKGDLTGDKVQGRSHTTLQERLKGETKMV